MRNRRLALAALVAALAATVLSGPPTHAESSAATAASARPQVGQCHQLTMAAVDSFAEPRAAVSCAASHTSRTIAVGSLPKGSTYANISDKNLTKVVTRACYGALDRKLGSTFAVRAQTLYTWFWFGPTKAERKAGAKWFRCDLGLVSGNRVQPLPSQTAATPVLGSGVTDPIRKCIRNSRGVYTACSNPHQFRPAKTFRYQRSGYPTSAQVDQRATRSCPSAAFLSWPSEVQWARGDHTVICYTKTTN